MPYNLSLLLEIPFFRQSVKLIKNFINLSMQNIVKLARFE